MDDIEALRAVMEAVHRRLESHDAKVDQSVATLKEGQHRMDENVSAIERNTERIAAAIEKFANGNGRNHAMLVKWLAGAVVLASLGSEGVKALVAAFGGPR